MRRSPRSGRLRRADPLFVLALPVTWFIVRKVPMGAPDPKDAEAAAH
jgi:hypothetical protein